MDISVLLDKTLEAGASDLHITAGAPPILRVNGELITIGEEKLTPKDTQDFAAQVLKADQLAKIEETGELDFSFSRPGTGRFRVNCYKQRNSYAIAFRLLYYSTLSMEKLGIPPVVRELSRRQRGLILVTGPTGMGKSTTLATMIQAINNERKCHIVTLEDPIEYLHKHDKSIINQREVGQDTRSFAYGLRAALRQDPDVILVGEMRDLDTISIAITAAETGHLVLSTVHTLGAAKTVDRIIDVFPPHQQQQIRIQLAGVIEGVISQQLLPRADGTGRVAAFEVMVSTPAIRNIVREGKNHQIDNAIQTGTRHGMQTMDQSLVSLFRQKLITREILMTHCIDPDMIKREVGF